MVTNFSNFSNRNSKNLFLKEYNISQELRKEIFELGNLKDDLEAIFKNALAMSAKLESLSLLQKGKIWLKK